MTEKEKLLKYLRKKNPNGRTNFEDIASKLNGGQIEFTELVLKLIDSSKGGKG